MPAVREHVLTEQRKTYTQLLCDVLVKPMLTFYQSMYNDVAASHVKGEVLVGKKEGVLVAFQRTLSSVPLWNQVMVQETFSKFMQDAQCAYFGDLLKATFKVHVQFMMMTSQKRIPKMHLKVPSCDTFVHRCLIELARCLYTSPQLMYHGLRPVERQVQWVTCEKLARKCVASVLRHTLPLESILSQWNEEEEEEEEEEEDDEEPASQGETETETESESDEEPPLDEELAVTESSTDNDESDEEEDDVLEVEVPMHDAEDATQEVVEVPMHDAEDAPQEVVEVPQEVVEVPQEVVADSPQEVVEVPQEVVADSPQEVVADSPQEVVEVPHDVVDVPHDVDVVVDVAEVAPQEVAEVAPQEVAEEVVAKDVSNVRDIEIRVQEPERRRQRVSPMDMFVVHRKKIKLPSSRRV